MPDIGKSHCDQWYHCALYLLLISENRGSHWAKMMSQCTQPAAMLTKKWELTVLGHMGEGASWKY